jgi:hypothetical protein
MEECLIVSLLTRACQVPFLENVRSFEIAHDVSM